MKAKRILPEISFGKRIWLVDAEEYCLIDSEDNDNRISGYDLRYSGKGYAFLYAMDRMNIVRDMEFNDIRIQEKAIERKDVLYVHIPHFAKMDPVGVMLKYKLSHSEAKTGNDHNIMRDRQDKIVRRIEKGKLLDDYILQEQKAEGNDVVEIEMADFLNRKLKLFKSIMEATPGLMQAVGQHKSRIIEFRDRSMAEKANDKRIEIKFFKK